jgi:hypothetical protein
MNTSGVSSVFSFLLLSVQLHVVGNMQPFTKSGDGILGVLNKFYLRNIEFQNYPL